MDNYGKHESGCPHPQPLSRKRARGGAGEKGRRGERERLPSPPAPLPKRGEGRSGGWEKGSGREAEKGRKGETTRGGYRLDRDSQALKANEAGS
jgi:hypothetical protein